MHGGTVTLVCGSISQGPETGIVEREGVRIVRVGSPALPVWDPRRWHAQVQSIRSAVKKYLGGSSWQVIHAHTPAFGEALFGEASSAARKVATVHSPIVEEQRINWAGPGAVNLLKRTIGLSLLRQSEARVLEDAGSVHVLSGYTKHQLLRMHGNHLEAKIAEIPWWVEPGIPSIPRREARRLLGWPADDRVVLTVRRFVRRMGLGVLVDACQLLRTDNALTVLVGTGPDAAGLKAQAARGPRSSRILFPGELSEEALGLAYAAADLFVLPTLELECFGLILLEAFGRGLPAIGTDVGAIPEVMRNVMPPEAIVPPGNASQLASTIDRILSGELRLPRREEIVSLSAAKYERTRVQSRYLDLLSGRASAL